MVDDRAASSTAVCACRAGAVSGGSLKPYALAVGAQSENSSRDAPRSLTFCVGPRTRAGVVVTVKTSRQVAGLARVGRGPPLGGEDVATEGLAHRDWSTRTVDEVDMILSEVSRHVSGWRCGSGCDGGCGDSS